MPTARATSYGSAAQSASPRYAFAKVLRAHLNTATDHAMKWGFARHGRISGMLHMSVLMRCNGFIFFVPHHRRLMAPFTSLIA